MFFAMIKATYFRSKFWLISLAGSFLVALVKVTRCLWLTDIGVLRCYKVSPSLKQKINIFI